MVEILFGEALQSEVGPLLESEVPKVHRVSHPNHTLGRQDLIASGQISLFPNFMLDLISQMYQYSCMNPKYTVIFYSFPHLQIHRTDKNFHVLVCF